MRNRPSSGVPWTLMANWIQRSTTLHMPYTLRQVGPGAGRKTGSRMGGGVGRRAPSLVTQFTVPAAPFGMIDRPRLALSLDEPVTLVCAPAGSGKTALVAANVPQAAWITLEPTDDDPTR